MVASAGRRPLSERVTRGLRRRRVAVAGFVCTLGLGALVAHVVSPGPPRPRSTADLGAATSSSGAFGPGYDGSADGSAAGGAADGAGGEAAGAGARMDGSARGGRGSTGGPGGATSGSGRLGGGASGRAGRGRSGGGFVAAGRGGREASSKQSVERRDPDDRSTWAPDREEGSDEDPGEEDDAEEDPVGVGLLAEVFKLVDERISVLPDRDLGAPTLTRLDPEIAFADRRSFGLPFEARNIIIRWRGYLRAAQDGVYTFLIGSDDGTRLLLDGRTILDMNRLQGHTEASADVELRQGFHPIEVVFFQNEGGASCVLQWLAPDGSAGVVPREVLFPADRVPPQEAPRITGIQPLRAKRGQVVTISGEGLPVAGEPFEVTFGQRPMSAYVSEEGTLQATVPPGIDRGQIVVRARGTASEGFPYEAGDVFGFEARYRTSQEQILTLAENPTGAVVFQRVEAPIDFRSYSQFRVPFPMRQVGVELTGQLYVPVSGPVRLALISDDGSQLFVDGQLALDHDGLHGPTRREAVVELSEGFHPARISFFQNRGGAALRLYWSLPGMDGFQAVPRGCLYPPFGYDIEVPPRVTSVEPPRAHEGDEIQILGEGFGLDAAAVRVAFRGLDGEVLDAQPDAIRVRVPRGARTGDLLVQRGSLAAEPVDFEVLGRGLLARYYRFAEKLDRIPQLGGRTPEVERVVEDLRFGEGYSFGLPYESQRFAATFQGAISAPRDGEYIFSLFSDDGSRLTIDGGLVVDNDGIHGWSGKDGAVTLTAGTHQILVEFFQNLGAANLDLLWRTPGARSRHRVPGDRLFPPE